MHATDIVRNETVLIDETVNDRDLDKLMQRAEAEGILYSRSELTTSVYTGTWKEWSFDRATLLDLARNQDWVTSRPFIYGVPAETRDDMSSRSLIDEFRELSAVDIADEIAFWMLDAQSSSVQDLSGVVGVGIENVALIVVDYETTCAPGFIPLARALLREQRAADLPDVVIYARQSGRFRLWHEAPVTTRRV